MDLKFSLVDEQAVISTRFAYRMLMTVCFVALIFVYSPQKETARKAAINEINALLDFDVSDAVWGAVTRHEKSASYLQHVQNILADYNLSLETSERRSFKDNLIEVSPIPPILKSSTLEQIDEYFIKLTQLRVSTLPIDKTFEQSVRQFLNERKSRRERKIVMNFGKNRYKFGGGSSSGPSIGIEGVPERDNSIIPFNILAFISDSRQHRILVSKAGERFLFLPNLKSLWDQIRTETPIQARTLLARQDTLRERKLEVFGVSIPQNLISWTIPTIAFAISVYFLVHLNYLRVVATRNPVVSEYPWIAIIPGHLALAVSIATILIFPAFALSSTVISTWVSAGPLLQMLSIATSVGTMIALAAGFAILVDIRSKTQTQPTQ